MTLVNRLEEIEKVAKGKSLPLISKLIDDVIKFDMENNVKYKKFSKEVSDGMLEMLFEDGIGIWFYRRSIIKKRSSKCQIVHLKKMVVIS